MPTGIGLMGMGRVGRNLLRILHTNDDLRIVAASDVVDPAALAYLVRFDSLLGRFPGEVRYHEDHLHMGDRKIKMHTEAKGSTSVPPWGELGVDVVVEATGKPRSRADVERHLAAGAKRVILCSPSEAPDTTVVFGVNEDRLRPEDRIVSVSSATVNAVGPVLKVLAGAFGIERAFLTTIHAFTNHQKLADVPDGDARRGRAAAENIIPQATRAADLLVDVLPELRGKISGSSMNVPVADGSAADLVCWHQKPVTVEAVNEAVRTAIAGDGLKSILGYETDPIVSSDILGLETSGRYDSLATMVLGGNASKTLTWFDNGWGYAHRVVDLLRRFERFESGKEGAQ
jgi:glyceraldehyde 3-phosphate dehydrogenase